MQHAVAKRAVALLVHGRVREEHVGVVPEAQVVAQFVSERAGQRIAAGCKAKQVGNVE